MENVPEKPGEFYGLCRTQAKALGPNSAQWAIACAFMDIAHALEEIAPGVGSLASVISDERGMREELCSTLIRVQEDFRKLVDCYVITNDLGG